MLRNSGYDKGFRTEILRAGIKGYNKILQDAKNGIKPIYRTKEWRKSTRRMDKQKKKYNWLGMYKTCIFVPPTPGAELQKLMQNKEASMRAGGAGKLGHKSY